MQQPITCRHCNQQFIPVPNKPGFFNECPVCVDERYSAKPVEEPVRQAQVIKPKVHIPMTPKQIRANERAMLRDIRELSRLLGNDPVLTDLVGKFEKSLGGGK